MSSTFRVGDLTGSTDVDTGEWLVENTRDWGVVHQPLPEGFQTYARVFHPAYDQSRTARGIHGLSADAHRSSTPFTTRSWKVAVVSHVSSPEA
jgi:hypothetical protein